MGLKLQAAFEEVRSRGFALVAGAVDEGVLAELQLEAERCPLERWPEVIGKVRQRMDGCFLRPPFGGYPGIAGIAGALVGEARASSTRGLRTWRPNEISVQRYEPGSIAIESHRDNIRYRRLVAILTTAGRARFRVLETREGSVLAEWTPEPGDLVLLRGPGLGGLRDGRPFHALDAPQEGERWSISFRMNTRAEAQRFLTQVRAR